MTPLTSAIALLALAVAIFAAFALYLRWHANRDSPRGSADRSNSDATAAFAARFEHVNCGDAGND